MCLFRLFGCALPLVLIGGGAPPALASAYFPAGAFSAKPADSDFFVEWYSTVLSGFKEPSLYDETKVSQLESYRFLWLRSFHRPVSIRLDMVGAFRATLTIKIGEPPGGDGSTRLFQTTKKVLTREQAVRFSEQVSQAGFWELAGFTGLEARGPDGSEWIIEGLRDHRYHVASRWTPRDGPIRALGLSFLTDLAGLKLAPSEIY